MVRAFLLAFLLFNIHITYSISPPKFPVDFSSNFDYISKNSRVTIRLFGHYAEDNASEMFAEVLVYPDHSMKQTLYNKALYLITRNVNGKITECLCSNTTYKDLGCPIFGLFQHFEIYEQNDTDIIWKVTDIPLPDGITILFRVKKVSPNIPAESIILFRIQNSSPSDANTTFIGFEPSQPNKDQFAIPNECAKVECKSSASFTLSPLVSKIRDKAEGWFGYNGL